jgi:hypothetical protein
MNGLAAGTWRFDRRGKALGITVIPFETFDPGIGDLIRKEAEDIGRIFGVPASVSFRTSCLPSDNGLFNFTPRRGEAPHR